MGGTAAYHYEIRSSWARHLGLLTPSLLASSDRYERSGGIAMPDTAASLVPPRAAAAHN
jgi:hypothetical protein